MDLRFARTISANRGVARGGPADQPTGAEYGSSGFIPTAAWGEAAHWRRRPGEETGTGWASHASRSRAPASSRLSGHRRIGAYLEACVVEGLNEKSAQAAGRLQVGGDLDLSTVERG